MGLESPLALLGLALAGLPIVAHLVRRRDLPRVPLPTLALLRRAQVQSRRRARLVDLLLLLVRIALVSVAALALSGPYANVSLAFGDGRVMSVAIVIDDSMSMSRTTGTSTLLARATSRARAAIGALPRGSEVAVVLAGSRARVLVRRTTELGAAADALGRVPTSSARGTDVARAVDRALRELAGARHEARMLLVLSDFARHARADEIEWPASEVEVRLERVGADARTDDWAVTDADARPDPSRSGRASIAVEVRGQGAPRTATVTVRAGGAVVGHAPIELGPSGGRTSVDVPLRPSGDPTATVELDGADALGSDDSRGVLLRRSASTRVLLVDGDPNVSRADDELRYLSRALDANPEQLDVRVVDADTLGPSSLAGIDVLWLANVAAPEQDVAHALEQFVTRGGGLVVSVGDRVDPRAYAAVLGRVIPARLTAVESPGDALALDAASARSPVPAAGAGLARVLTRHRVGLEAPTRGGRTVLAFADGRPAVMVAQVGRGNVALLTTTIDDDWTDLPYRPGFVPLVSSLVTWASPAVALAARAYAPSEPITLPVPPGATRLVITDPAGRAQDLDVASGARSVVFRGSDRPGAYRTRVRAPGADHAALADAERLAFVVAPPREESDLVVSALPRAHGARASDARQASATVRRSIAPWLFVLCGVLACVEGALRLSRSRRAARATLSA